MQKAKLNRTISIPQNFIPRWYQIPLIKAMDNGCLRAAHVWHRRAGKDKNDFCYIAKRAFLEVGIYYYFFPTYAQGKKALWDAIDRNGYKVINHIPEDLIFNKNDTEMKITLKHPYDKKKDKFGNITKEPAAGSIIQIIGTDNIDSIVGTNPIGCVFSEYSLQDPSVWDFIKPILEENGGWAIFNFTPRGENHAYDLYKLFEKRALAGNSKYFVQTLTIEDTKVLTEAQIREIREEDIEKNGDDSITEQEWFCSFSAAVQGSYYQTWFKELNEKGKINESVQALPNLSVHTAWDIGVDDHNIIWFFQTIGDRVIVIDYYENKNKGLGHYIKVVQNRARENGWALGMHIGPHDIRERDYTGTYGDEDPKTRAEIAEETYGFKFEILDKTSVADGIETVRELLPKCEFNIKKCRLGVRALKAYHKKFDEKKNTYINHPEHDWSSHAADAFRYLAIGIRKYIPKIIKSEKEILEDTFKNQAANRVKAIYDIQRERLKEKQNSEDIVYF